LKKKTLDLVKDPAI